MKGPRTVIRKKSIKYTTDSYMADYEEFCKILREGDILYNVDTTNNWGKTFLVAAKLSVVLGKVDTFAVVLLGVDIKGDKIVPNGQRVDITPQKAPYVYYLVVVGHCEYNLVPVIDNNKINHRMIVLYKSMDLHQFVKRHPRKPRLRRYGDDGNPIVKPTKNKHNETENQGQEISK